MLEFYLQLSAVPECPWHRGSLSIFVVPSEVDCFCSVLHVRLFWGQSGESCLLLWFLVLGRPQAYWAFGVGYFLSLLALLPVTAKFAFCLGWSWTGVSHPLLELRDICLVKLVKACFSWRHFSPLLQGLSFSFAFCPSYNVYFVLSFFQDSYQCSWLNICKFPSWNFLYHVHSINLPLEPA